MVFTKRFSRSSGFKGFLLIPKDFQLEVFPKDFWLQEFEEIRMYFDEKAGDDLSMRSGK